MVLVQTDCKKQPQTFRDEISNFVYELSTKPDQIYWSCQLTVKKNDGTKPM